MMYTAQDEIRSFDESSEESSYKEDYRTSFRRDYARLIHSPSFRRLQGKTQLFPCFESDYFRNRLTHSIEVAQIAKSIAIQINKFHLPKDTSFHIDLDLIELAGLAHDIGHPPFGHQGEKALDECMYEYGGFEGNAQTLRVLSRLEKKKQSGGEIYLGGFDEQGYDRREGLNLTYRSLASILKYDEEIPSKREKKINGDFPSVVKGYYLSEKDLVDRIKAHVTNGRLYEGSFKTIECQIMDIADDIAYSTFDLEDAFKLGFIHPFDILAAKPVFYQSVANLVAKALKKKTFDSAKVVNIISDVFKVIFNIEDVKELIGVEEINEQQAASQPYIFFGSQFAYRYATLIAGDGYTRTDFISKLIDNFVDSIKFEFNPELPALSKVTLKNDTKEKIEVLKQVAFQSQILSPKLKIAEFRGKEIINKIFETLIKNSGYQLLPEDMRIIYQQKQDREHQLRTICDYIACMTDRYAIEFYGRLTSENPETIFKPY